MRRGRTLSRPNPSLSLVVLAFNEEAAVGPFLEQCLAYLDRLPPDPEAHEIVVVDDGSSDATAARVAEIAGRDPRVRLVRHAVNQGMGAGMRSGYGAATKDLLCMLPADGQIPPGEIDKLLPGLARAPIVTSVYSSRPSERYRVVLSAGLRALIRATLGITFRLEGIYLFPRELAQDRIGLDRIGSTTFFFSFELVARAVGAGVPVHTVVVEPQARQAGASKVANVKRIRRVAAELFRFRLRLLREGRQGP